VLPGYERDWNMEIGERERETDWERERDRDMRDDEQLS
jgi:hypothetical protein